MIAPNLPEVARTSEQFQATLASIWIEASGRRSTNGVDWWSYIDRMPATPVPRDNQRVTGQQATKKQRDDPMDEHPMNPINQEGYDDEIPY